MFIGEYLHGIIQAWIPTQYQGQTTVAWIAWKYICAQMCQATDIDFRP